MNASSNSQAPPPPSPPYQRGYTQKQARRSPPFPWASQKFPTNNVSPPPRSLWNQAVDVVFEPRTPPPHGRPDIPSTMSASHPPPQFSATQVLKPPVPGRSFMRRFLQPVHPNQRKDSLLYKRAPKSKMNQNEPNEPTITTFHSPISKATPRWRPSP